jgi:DNA-directed RNA polymerase specialized sigma24 family protein
MKILVEKTDMQNPLTMNEIITELPVYGIKSERKSIYTDIEILRQFGLDIETSRIERGLKRNRVKQDEKGRTVRDKNGLPILLPEREVSLEKLIDEGWDYPTLEPSPEDSMLSVMFSEVAELHRCIALLNDDEQALIIALFFDGKTEREYAGFIGISKTALHARKVKAINKIKSFFVS